MHARNVERSVPARVGLTRIISRSLRRLQQNIPNFVGESCAFSRPHTQLLPGQGFPTAYTAACAGASIAIAPFLYGMPNDAVRTILTRKLRRRSVIDAVSAALRVCAPGEADGLLAMLLDVRRARPNADALAAAARNWGKISQNTRDRLLERVGDMRRMLDALAGSSDDLAREAACDLIADAAADDACIDRLRPLLVDASPGVRAAAARALHAIESAADRSDDVRVSFDALLAFAAGSFADHRRRDVMDLIARRIHNPGPALRAWLESPDDAGLMGLRAALRRIGGDGGALRTFRLAAHPSLGGACAEALAKSHPDDEREAMLARRALLARQPRLRRIARAPIATAILGDPVRAASFTDNARLGAVALTGAGAMDEAERAARLAALLRDPEARVRHAATRAVADARPGPHAGLLGPREGLLADFSHDEDARVAHAAAVALACDRAGASTPRRALLTNLLRSRHASVRAVAEYALDGADPWRSPCAARRLLTTDRDGFIRALRERIARANDSHQRLGATALARRLRVVREVELELLAAASAPDTRVASAAASALGQARSDAARSALTRLCDHSDARVRANALDALSRAVSTRTAHNAARADADAVFLRALTDAHPRCVAAAVAGLAAASAETRPEALSACEALVRAGIEAMRAAGLWATERAGLTSLSEDVCAILRAPVSDDERRRAARCARALLRRFDRPPRVLAPGALAEAKTVSARARHHEQSAATGAPHATTALDTARADPEVVIKINAREMAW